MELYIVNRSLEKAKGYYRKLLPLWSRNLKLDSLNTKNVTFHPKDQKDFEGFQDNWGGFINYLDIFWNQLNAYAKHHVSDEKKESLMGYLGNVSSQRTSDELLVYLDKARNNSQHTLWVHIKESSPFEVITGKGASIAHKPGQIIVSGSGDSTKEINIVLRPGLIMLKEVKVIENKKEVIYELPTLHLNNKLSNMERVLPQIIGQKGIQYYSNIFIELKKRT